MKKNILRFFGAFIGLVSVAFGIYELTLEYPGTLNLLNELCFIIAGAWFLFYGLTGKSPFFDEDNKKPDSNKSE